jgi:hypothetical protein
VQFADYLQLRTRLLANERPAAPDEVVVFAQKALRQPFRLNAVRFDLAESDCVVFVERCISAALATDWHSYRLIADRLRHRDGIVHFRQRHFSTLADWVPANTKWVFRDISAELADEDGTVAENYTFVVRPKVFVDSPAINGHVRTTFKGSDYKSQDITLIHDSFVPKDNIHSILSSLRSGDVVLILRKSSGGHLACTHMGIVVVDLKSVSMVSSGPPKVRAIPLSGMSGYDWVAGYKFLRLRDDARTIAQREMNSVSTQPSPPSVEDQKVAELRKARGQS